jgi:hypothetical protein
MDGGEGEVENLLVMNQEVAHRSQILYVTFRSVPYGSHVELWYFLSQSIFNIFTF